MVKPFGFDKLQLVAAGDGYTTILVNGQDLMELFDGAGDCIGPGEPSNEWFFQALQEGVHRRRMILRCNCGYSDCMSLHATVKIEHDSVTWDEFEGERGRRFEHSFRFRRQEYDAELAGFLKQLSP